MSAPPTTPNIPVTREAVSAALAILLGCGIGWRPDRTWAELGFLIGELDARGLSWSICSSHLSDALPLAQANVNRRKPGPEGGTTAEKPWLTFETAWDADSKLALCRAALAALTKEQQQ